ncbi:MAG: hypothetical protein GXO73_00145 [Calditrichaeota bacterium]|nr:hypothetical protein [Calditrichota bacterium]
MVYSSVDYRYFHKDGTKRKVPELDDSPPRRSPRKTAKRSSSRSRPKSKPVVSSSAESSANEGGDSRGEGDVTDADDPVATGCRAAMLLALTKQGIIHPDLGYTLDQPEEDEASEWIVRSRGGGPVKLAKSIQGINAGVTVTHVCREFNDPPAPAVDFNDFLIHRGKSWNRLVLPGPVGGEHNVSDDEAWCDDHVQPLQWYVEHLDALMYQTEFQSAYTKSEVAALKLVRRVFRPGQTCLFCDDHTVAGLDASKLFLRWRQLARHIVENHLREIPTWDCVRPSNANLAKARCPTFKSKGKFYTTKRRGAMVRHLLSHGVSGHSRSILPAITDARRAFWNRFDKSKRMVVFTMVPRRVQLGHGTLVIPYGFRLMAQSLYAPKEDEIRRHRNLHQQFRRGKPVRMPQTPAGRRVTRAKQVLLRSSKKRGEELAKEERSAQAGKEVKKGKGKSSESTSVPAEPAAPAPVTNTAKGVAEWPTLLPSAPAKKKKRSRPNRRRSRSVTTTSTSDTTPNRPKKDLQDPEWQGSLTSLGKVPRRVSATVVTGEPVASGSGVVPTVPPKTSSDTARAGRSTLERDHAGGNYTKVRIVNQDACIDLTKLVTALDADHAVRATEKIRSCVESLVDVFIDDYQDSTQRSMNLAEEKLSSSRGDLETAQSREIAILKNQVLFWQNRHRESNEEVAMAEMHFEANFGHKFRGWDGSLAALDFSRFSVEDRLRGVPLPYLDAIRKVKAVSETRRSPTRERGRSQSPHPGPSLESLALNSPRLPVAAPPPDADVVMKDSGSGDRTQP